MRLNTKARLVAVAWLVAVAAITNGSAPAAGRPAEDLLAQAGEEARLHLNRFLAYVRSLDDDRMQTAAVKIESPSAKGKSEFLWIVSVTPTSDGRFLGRHANPSASPADAIKSRAVTFSRDQVRDWSFVGPDHKLYGSFAARAILPGMDPHKAARISSVLSDMPVPDDW